MRRLLVVLILILAACGGSQVATPTLAPTIAPTATTAPTIAPTAPTVPTIAPTATTAPTLAPTATTAPTIAPTATIAPTIAPSATAAPTIAPTATTAPTIAPTATTAPTIAPTATIVPTIAPAPAASAADVRISVDGDGEIVRVQNVGGTAQDMTGWVVQSVGGGTCELLPDQLFVFPAGFVLAAGAEVRLVSGPGAAGDGQSVLWWTEKNIWANGGDRGELRDDAGRVVSSYPYGSCRR